MRSIGHSARLVALSILTLSAAGCTHPPSSQRDPERHTSVSSATQSNPSAAKGSARLIVIADIDGTLETCGCEPGSLASLDRLAAAVATARSENRTSIVIAFGSLYATTRLQRSAAGMYAREMASTQHTAELLTLLLPRMGLDIAAPNTADLLTDGQRLQALGKAGVDILQPAAVAHSDSQLPRSVLRRVGNVSLGVVSALGETSPQVLAAEIESLRGSGAQLTLVFAPHELLERAPQLWMAANAPDYVAIAETDAASKEEIVGRTKLLRVPTRARGFALLDVAAQKDGALDAQISRVTLTEDSPSDVLVRAELDGLFARVNRENSQLGQNKREPGNTSLTSPRFVGSDTCAACHTSAYLWWRETSHARAFATLEQRRRQLDLECIGCHVTGFDQPDGATLSEHKHLEGVGCESCHGPGGAHADAPQRVRSSVRAVNERVCMHCHDAEHSPGFDYQRGRSHLISAAHGGR